MAYDLTPPAPEETYDPEVAKAQAAADAAEREKILKMSVALGLGAFAYVILTKMKRKG